MMFRNVTFLILVTFLTLVTSNTLAQPANTQEADQQINDFVLSGSSAKGKRTWDISGKSADIFTETVKLNDIVSNLYGEKEDIKLTADKGDFDRIEGRIHLEQNVVVTTSTGAKLTTDSLDWDRKNNIVTTNDPVNIQRNEMLATAKGASGHPDLNKVELTKDVTVDITPQNPQGSQEPQEKEKIIITCDGPLQIDYAKNIATFNNNVKVDRQDSQIYSDMMDVYFSKTDDTDGQVPTATNDTMASKIAKIIAKGNVKIVRGENISYSDEAIYSASEKKITLTGSPKLILYSTEDLSASFGN